MGYNPPMKKYPKPDYVLAESLLTQLKSAHWSELPANRGMHAYGYTPAEQQAIDIVVREAVDHQGMEAFSDLAGNVYLIKRGRNAHKNLFTPGKTDVIVSHLDTVEKGGPHDGRDGICAGLGAVAGYNKAKRLPENDLCIMIARSEESCINGQVSIGAGLATGELTYKQLEGFTNRTTKRSVISHMQELGIPVATLQGRLDASPTLFPTRDDAKSLIGFLAEAHIEQGEYCARQNIELGTVTAIRGNTRFKDVKIEGAAGHSGAHFEDQRADAVRAGTRLLAVADEWFERKQAEGHDIVYTPARFNTTNTSPTTISDNATLTFEIRSSEEPLLHEFAKLMQETARDLEGKNKSGKLKINLPPPIITRPAKMDSGLVDHVQNLAKEMGIKTGLVTSGAGHDTASFARTGIPSVMLFIKQFDPVSHVPHESRSKESFQRACDMLSAMLANPRPDLHKHATNAPSGADSFTDYLKLQGATPYTPGQWQK